MSDSIHGAVPKVHPATREALPEDPMEIQGFETPGDPEFMLQILVEEYARIGWDAEAILELARDPNYRAFHGLWRLYGDEMLAERIREKLSRCGTMRVRATQAKPSPKCLVQIEISDGLVLKR